MNPFKLMVAVALLAFASFAMAQEKVDSKGITAKIKLEEALSGYLEEINGKYKVRATEAIFAPGAHLGAHHHSGPGIRYVVSGQLTFVQAGKARIYHAGDFFYESGNVVHLARNDSKAPVKIVFFEILPADWKPGSAIVPRIR